MNRSVDYDHIAPTYDRRYEQNQYAGVEQALLEFVNRDSGQQVLEVGCGTGHWLQVLHAWGLNGAGLDASAEMLARAQAGLPGIALVQGRAERLPWTAESFDRVFCINALHHFVDKQAFLAEARRILRPGGMMLTVGLDPHRGTDQWYVYEYFPGSAEIDKQRFPASSTIREWMHNVGFQNCVTGQVQHFATRLPARQALEQGRLDKTRTSQLSILTEEEYQRGIQRIRLDLEHAEARGQTLFLVTDLRLYGTSGSVNERPYE